jgi:hypothetical protein
MATGDEFEENSNLIIAWHPLLEGAFGLLDGLNLPVQSSSDEEIENATYNGWLHEHFISSVFVFSAKGQIHRSLSLPMLKFHRRDHCMPLECSWQLA